MTLATLTKRLIAEGTIERVRVNRYRVNDTRRARQFQALGRLLTLTQVHSLFMEQIPFSNEFRFRSAPEERQGCSAFRGGNVPEGFAGFTYSRPEPQPKPRRTITRRGYHSSGAAIRRQGVSEALARIAFDEDGVRRSYGIEYEIYSLDADQEDKLARLLDTLPAHTTERDGSLGNTGVEIVFLPMSKQDLIRTFNTLKEFVRENRIPMNNTGSHITYGVSNSEIVDLGDLQIRLNRIALAVKSTATQGAIKRVFGRDFTGYAQLPNSTTYSSHSNAWSASRGTSAYELRLCNYAGDIEKMVAFMEATEFVFHRTFTTQDFINIFTIMGSDCNGI